MASTSETGHAINIAQYKLIIDTVTTFGSLYAPTNINLTVAKMTSQWSDEAALQSAYLDAWDKTKMPINAREILYLKMDSVTRRSKSVYISSDATKQDKDNAKKIAAKILGDNVKVKKLANGEPDPAHISNSQLSFVNKAGNFEQLLNIYAVDSNYDTNEADLKLTAMQSLLSDIKAANETVNGKNVEAGKFRKLRDHGLYDVETGIIDRSLACKEYVKGLFGASSPEARSVTKIYLRRCMTIKPV